MNGQEQGYGITTNKQSVNIAINQVCFNHKYVHMYICMYRCIYLDMRFGNVNSQIRNSLSFVLSHYTTLLTHCKMTVFQPNCNSTRTTIYVYSYITYSLRITYTYVSLSMCPINAYVDFHVCFKNKSLEYLKSVR